MLKKGDKISIALILANVIFISLLITKGAYTISDVPVKDNGSDISSMPVLTIMPTIAAYPLPTMTLAVDDGAALLIPWIQSQPRDESPAPSAMPIPSSTPEKTDGNILDIAPAPATPVPSPTMKPADDDKDDDKDDDDEDDDRDDNKGRRHKRR